MTRIVTNFDADSYPDYVFNAGELEWANGNWRAGSSPGSGPRVTVTLPAVSKVTYVGFIVGYITATAEIRFFNEAGSQVGQLTWTNFPQGWKDEDVVVNNVKKVQFYTGSYFDNCTIDFEFVSGPSADFTVGVSGISLQKHFTSLSVDATGGTEYLTKYEWDFDGDGVYEVETTNPVYTHVFPHEGLYKVTLRVTQDGGQIDTATHFVTVSSANVPQNGYFHDSLSGQSYCIVNESATYPQDGNPIGLVAGEKTETITDLSVNTPVGALEFTRTFRQSQLNTFADVGMGWTHNQIALIDDSDIGNGKLIVQIPGGGFVKFTQVGISDIFQGDPGSTSQIDTSGSGLTSYVLTAQDKTIWQFDDSNRLRKRIRPNGEEWIYSYYTSGQAINLLESVDDGYGRSLQFTYVDNSGQFDDLKLWRVGDQDATGLDSSTPSGRYIEFTYIAEMLDNSLVTTPRALLSEVRDVRGNIWTYDYYGQDSGEDNSDLANYLLQVISPMVDTDGDGIADNTITLNDQTYTKSGGVIAQIIQKRGQVGTGTFLEEATYKFQPDGNPITTQTQANRTTTHYFLNGVYVGPQDAAGNSSYQLQNTDYRPQEQYDAKGNKTQLEWNNGKTLTSVTDAEGNITSFEYLTDGTERLDYVIDAEGRKTEYAYDDMSYPDLRQPVTIKIKNASNNLLRMQEFVYDTMGRITSEKEIDPSDETTVLRKTERTYGTSGNGNGLLESFIQRDLINPSNDQSTSYTYDRVGRVIKTSKSSLFGSCLVSYTVYDQAGNVVASICNYDAGMGSDPTDADSAANLYNPSYPNKNQVTTHEYDTLGRRVSTTTNDGNIAQKKTTRVIYDALGRVICQIANYKNPEVSTVPIYGPPKDWTFREGVWKDEDHIDGTIISHGDDLNENIISQTKYNARGLVCLTRDHLGRVTLYGYDDADRLVKTIQNAGEPDYNNDYSGTGSDPDLSDYVENTSSDVLDVISQQAYDAVGNLAKTIDSAGRVTLTGYDALNRPIRVIQNAYDSDYDYKSNPTLSGYIAETNADYDQISETEYDSLGRVIRSRQLIDKTNTDKIWDVSLYGYDSLGRQLKVIAHASDSTYDIAADPDLSEYTASTSVDEDIITETFYNAEGQVSYTKDSLGRETHFAYDGLQRQVLTVNSFAENGSSTYQDLTDWTWNTNKWTDGSIDIQFGNANDENSISQTVYDINGYVESSRDINGSVQRFVYDDLGRQRLMIASYVAQGTVDNWIWDDNHSRWEDGSGNAILHGSQNDQNIISETVYDNQGRVSSTRDAQGNVSLFVYDSANRRVRTIQNYIEQGSSDPSDWFWDTGDGRWEYDTNTPVAHGSQNDQNQINITQYDFAGRVVSTMNVRGNVTQNVYDALGRRIRTIQNYVDNGEDPSLWVWDGTTDNHWEESDGTTAINHGTNYDQNIISDMSYNKAGQLLASRNQDGNEMRYLYDQAGRRITSIQNYVVQGSSDPVDWMWNADQKQWEDGAENVISHGTDFDQNLINQTSYDKRGQIKLTRDTRGTETRFSYDKSARRVVVIQAANTLVATTTYTCFDKAGRVLRTIANWIDNGVDPDELDGGGSWLFDPNTHGSHNDQNLITEFEYDHLGRRIQISNPVKDDTQTSYFKDGLVDSMTDPENIVTIYRYDALRRRTRVVQSFVANGEDPKDWVWDVDTDNRWEESDGTAISYGTDNDENIIVDVAYDTLGRMIQMRDPRGNVTSYEYDLLGHRTKLTNPLNIEWETTYANDGNTTKTSMLYPNSIDPVVRKFDRLGRLTEIDYNDLANTPKVQFAYDADGNRQTMTEYDSGGKIRETSYEYDNQHRLTSVGFNNDGDLSIDETVSYEYDIAGNRTKLTLPGSDDISYAYDSKGRLVSMTDWDGQVSTFQYDNVGRHVGTQRNNGFYSRYHYSPAGHLQELRHGEGHNVVKALNSFIYETDKRGNRTQVKELKFRDSAGSSNTISHDDESIVYTGDWQANGSYHETTTVNAKLAVMFYGDTGIELTMGTGSDCGIYDVYINQTLWQSYDGYAASPSDDVIALEVKGQGPHLLEVFQRHDKNSASSDYKVRFKQLVALSAYDMETIDYTYDNLSRLLTANYDGGAVEYSYGYDLAGNLVNNNGVTNTFNDANQLTGDGTDTFEYDDNGNLWKTNSVVSHTWDKANRLLSHGGLDYAYDGLGNRISQDNGTDVTKYLLDIQAGLPRVLSETVGANVTQFIHSPRGLHATQNNSGNWFWGLQDGLGSNRAEVDVNGAVVASQDFTPYGVAQNVTGSFNSPHAFTGEPLDGNGLQYHRARYYSPQMGIWASLDPFEGVYSRPMSLNSYSYVENNPVMRVDWGGDRSYEISEVELKNAPIPIVWLHFYHGSLWGGMENIISSGIIGEFGKGDFGQGFYTHHYPADNTLAYQGALSWAVKNNVDDEELGTLEIQVKESDYEGLHSSAPHLTINFNLTSRDQNDYAERQKRWINFIITYGRLPEPYFRSGRGEWALPVREPALNSGCNLIIGPFYGPLEGTEDNPPSLGEFEPIFPYETPDGSYPQQYFWANAGIDLLNDGDKVNWKVCKHEKDGKLIYCEIVRPPSSVQKEAFVRF